MKAVVAAFNQEKALVGAFSVITNLWIELFEAPLKVRMVSSVAVPLETRQLIRRIQRADQLTVAINLQVRAALVLGILSSSNIFLCSEKLTRHADGSRSFGVHRFDLCRREIPSTTGNHVI